MSETRFYGGQAVIEGVMMRGRDTYATAVRRRDGSIVVDKQPVPHFLEGWRVAKLPLVRGTFALIEALTLGLRSLQFSGNVALQDELEAEAEQVSHQTDEAQSASRPWLAVAFVALLGVLAIVVGAPQVAPWVARQFSMLGSARDVLLATRLAGGLVTLLLMVVLLVPSPKRPAGPKTLSDSAMWLAVMPAFAIGIGLFVLVPSWLAGYLRIEGGYGVAILKNLVEGIIRLALILGYIALISHIGQVRRVFQYHGAEHKVINTLEIEGVVEEGQAREHSSLHPRCGTAFLLLFIVLKIIVGCFFGWPVWYWRLALRLAMVPVVAALAFEVTRLAGKYRNSPFVKLISAPGLLLQRMTTREPEAPMIQVAMYALAAVAPEVSLPADWPPPQESGLRDVGTKSDGEEIR
ncbi:MAG: DUF1385 domain-containing protein [Candidatus Zipacnadales bacterium]